ncbi:MAG: hypothetical protein NC541_15345 [bacterium]|nr:hypothetical protein [bacterium]
MSRIKPILFNTEMVRAILEGRKTVTRRVCKYSNHDVYEYACTHGRWCEGGAISPKMIEGYIREKKMPCQPGDILYVRETWYYETFYESTEEKAPDLSSGNRSWRYVYKADNPDYPVIPGKWSPSIHMPKEAARIWLKVTNVRLERLADMRLDDFLSEGASILPETFNDPENVCRQAKNQFIGIWDSTIRKPDFDKYGWEANPWVWVIEFERCGKPERDMDPVREYP